MIPRPHTIPRSRLRHPGDQTFTLLQQDAKCIEGRSHREVAATAKAAITHSRHPRTCPGPCRRSDILTE